MSKQRVKLKKATRLQRDQNVYLTDLEKRTLGIGSNGETPYVVLKYYQVHFECLSTWQANELHSFCQFIEKFRNTTWQEIYKTGGQLGTKTRFGYTPHKDRSHLPKHPELDRISEDITFFELRVTEKARVHGFRVKEAFFLVWLDREHQIFPM